MNRGEIAKGYFLQGYNCAQAVAMAYDDIIGIDKDTIAKLVSGYGGGMGRMREVCGAVSGAVFVISNVHGYSDASDKEAKMALYTIIQQFGEKFKDANGSIICRELLELNKKGFDSPTPSERTAEYYKKRPCSELVEISASILEDFINLKD